MRIASLLASNTEIACALGLESELVGISHECDCPDSIKGKPVLTTSAVDPTKKSDEIDRDVKNLLQNALSLYHVDEALLKKVNPDVILTQDQCEVCAVSLNDVKKALVALGSHADVISLKPRTLGEIFDDIETIGKATNRTKESKTFVLGLKARVEAIRKKTADLKTRPTVCNIEWIDPLMVAGNWCPEMIEIAGGINVMSTAGEHTGYAKFEELIKIQPDKIVIAPCGFKLKQTQENMPLITKRPEWKTLKAVQNNEVYLVDGNAYFNRPSHRMVDSLEILAHIIHPKIFPKKDDKHVIRAPRI